MSAVVELQHRQSTHRIYFQKFGRAIFSRCYINLFIGNLEPLLREKHSDPSRIRRLGIFVKLHRYPPATIASCKMQLHADVAPNRPGGNPTKTAAKKGSEHFALIDDASR